MDDMGLEIGVQRADATTGELLASDVDAVAVFRRRWLHGPQAVPAEITVDEIGELVETVRRTGLTYMMGGTI